MESAAIGKRLSRYRIKTIGAGRTVGSLVRIGGVRTIGFPALPPTDAISAAFFRVEKYARRSLSGSNRLKR
jgi:hypothetical protein